MGGGLENHYYYNFFGGGHMLPKTPKMALFSEYLAADLSPDALGIINIG